MIYLDNASTTKLDNSAKREMLKTLSIFGNPSSLHSTGRIAKNKLEEARASIANSLTCLPEEIYFTSGATESNNWAIENACRVGKLLKKNKIITTPFEHSSVLNCIKEKIKEGYIVEYLPVYNNGIVKISDLKKMLTKDVCLVSVMYVNNEIGTIQPIKKIAELCKSKNIYFHTDATQAVGHIELNLIELGATMVSASAHKFGGPKGVGFLYCNKDTKLESLFKGGNQENGKRAGTENLVSIIGMAKALEESTKDIVSKKIYLENLRLYLLNKLIAIPNTLINGDKYNCIPGIINVCFKDIDGETLQLFLDNEGVCVSTASACESKKGTSYVLAALKVPKSYIHGNIRISLSINNTKKEIKNFIKKLKKCLTSLYNSATL